MQSRIFSDPQRRSDGPEPAVSISEWAELAAPYPLLDGLDPLRAGIPQTRLDPLPILSAWEVIRSAMDGNTAATYPDHIRADEHVVTNLYQSNAGLGEDLDQREHQNSPRYFLRQQKGTQHHCTDCCLSDYFLRPKRQEQDRRRKVCNHQR